jgi:transposase InsO family protein
MKGNEKISKVLRAKELGVSVRSLYYKPLKPTKDWELKCQIELVLRDKPSYGHRRIADHLKINKKRVRRVMRLFGIKPYRRRVSNWKKKENVKVIYPNLLLTNFPQYENHIWVSDFTYIKFQEGFVYLATVLDIFTRKVVGFSVYTTQGVELTLSALMSSLHNNPRPKIFHSDNGSQYNAEIFIKALETVGIQISRSAPGCPWENGYQESFFSQFKVDLGDPNRFKTLGELVYEIYHQIYVYNNERIHSAFHISPVQFAEKVRLEYN